MIAPLTNDPAWVRYEWELRHLALLDRMEQFAAMCAAETATVVEAMRVMRDAFAAYARSPSYRRLAEALQMAQRGRP